MLSIGIANATGESSGGILWPVPPRSHRLFLAANIGVARAITRLKRLAFIGSAGTTNCS